MKGLVILTTILFSILLVNFSSAICAEGQIDINTASLEELDNLSRIGPAKAQAIINSRPFNSVDELARVKGIGNKTLDNIKSQGLACVREDIQNNKIEENEGRNKSVSSSINQSHQEEIQETPEPIFLGSKKEGENPYS